MHILVGEAAIHEITEMTQHFVFELTLVAGPPVRDFDGGGAAFRGPKVKPIQNRKSHRI